MRALLTALLLVLPLAAAGPKVKFTTSLGAFTVQLEPHAAPKTVENFLAYVRKGHYNGLVFHRVAKGGSVIQGGGYTVDMRQRATGPSITNEADLAKAKGLRNRRGVLAMAYAAGNPLGAKAQFFVNVKDNPSLDFKSKTMTGYGHCPFGKVVEGMAVVDKIAKVKTRTDERPEQPVLIQRVEELR